MSEYIEHDREGVTVGIVEKQFFTFAEPPGELELESGSRLGPVTIAYETYGSLSPNRDNVILVTHALSGDSHAAGYYSGDDSKPGWWDIMVGPGKGIDTDQYFVICTNIIGSCMGPLHMRNRCPAQEKGRVQVYIQMMLKAFHGQSRYLVMLKERCIVDQAGRRAQFLTAPGNEFLR